MDHEAKGNFAQLDYGMRVYDPRAGRFLSVDPLTRNFPTLTPFQYASNSPIINIDLDGLEGKNSNSKTEKDAKGVPLIGPIQKEVIDKGSKQVFKEGVKKTLTTAAAEAGGLTLILVAIPKGGPKFPNNDESYHLYPYETFRKRYPLDPPHRRDLLEFTLPLYQPKDTYKPKTPETPIQTPDEDEGPEFIYRGGAYSDLNFTPRPGKDDGVGPKSGLSVFVTPLQATQGKSGKVQILSARLLRTFGFVLQIEPDGHVGIRPRTQAELEEWAASRPKLETSGPVHINTQTAKASRIGEVKVSSQNP